MKYLQLFEGFLNESSPKKFDSTIYLFLDLKSKKDEEPKSTDLISSSKKLYDSVISLLNINKIQFTKTEDIEEADRNMYTLSVEIKIKEYSELIHNKIVPALKKLNKGNQIELTSTDKSLNDLFENFLNEWR